ncbi:MAG TPA: glycosyltransferase family 4 protein [Verrucomicrobiae bacterium]|nr:glycosyltransferase family 4 protein [Verrucomicrobiae bacterium]
MAKHDAGGDAVAGSLRIAQVAPLYERVPPALYGGTERVVGYITEELVRRGHQVTLFASGDSVTEAELVAAAEKALRLNPDARDTLSPHVIELGQVAERAAEFDLIHCHVDYLAFPISQFAPTPTVHTMHGRLDQPEQEAVFRQFNNVPLISISDSQRQPLRHLGLNWLGTVYHGLPPDGYTFSPRGGEYLAFLGRLSPEKRPDLAIEVAKRVGLPLKIAAKVDEADRTYYEREIEPLLGDSRIELVGEIGDDDKSEFLGGARALLFPIDWPEPFGLVMIEAMACGTPVITRPMGSVPEIIESGRTGLIANTVEELVEAVKRIDSIDRATCRREFERRFTVSRMVDDYEAIYRTL